MTFPNLQMKTRQKGGTGKVQKSKKQNNEREQHTTPTGKYYKFSDAFPLATEQTRSFLHSFLFVLHPSFLLDTKTLRMRDQGTLGCSMLSIAGIT